MADSTDAVKEIETLLAAEVEKERAANTMTMKVGGGLCVVVAGYLLWVSSAIGTLLDPVGLATAASGFAIGAVPEASAEVRTLVVDGAPELVGMGADELIGMIPGYRLQLQAEFDPVLDDVSKVLAEAAVAELARSGGDPSATYTTDEALAAGADAAIAHLDGTLDAAMDQPDDEGGTPRKSIEASLVALEKIDAQLAIMAKKGGDPRERELLVAWLGVVGAHKDAEEVALVEDAKQAAKAAAKAADAKPEAKPADGAKAPEAPAPEAQKPAGN